jgi:hypothetical protein
MQIAVIRRRQAVVLQPQVADPWVVEQPLA